MFVGEVKEHDQHGFLNLLVEFEVLVGEAADSGDSVVGDPFTQPAYGVREMGEEEGMKGGERGGMKEE